MGHPIRVSSSSSKVDIEEESYWKSPSALELAVLSRQPATWRHSLLDQGTHSEQGIHREQGTRHKELTVDKDKTRFNKLMDHSARLQQRKTAASVGTSSTWARSWHSNSQQEDLYSQQAQVSPSHYLNQDYGKDAEDMGMALSLTWMVYAFISARGYVWGGWYSN
ncbi:hypothetical protein O0I10_010363 [Lichtheimia ornata]|uniref:Uncharacterized protein n=1 Tax=Lichtheimia ornata TaxID=688661 RepID=A0AAD7UV44_9FUNG|nr:uncharacterized protein O0I10_010363 [Lichtheimia ornata]KAJ8654027.1 hypothetical protein O0I10_010363 [Lichtheimia ornata]